MIEQINNLAQLWWGWTSAMFWQVGLLIALIALLDRLIRKWAWPQLRYALWSLILVKLVLSPGLFLPSGLVPKLRPLVAQVLEKATNEQRVAQELPPVRPFFNDRITYVPTQSEPHLILSLEDASAAGDSVSGRRPTTVAGPQLNWQGYAMGLWFLGMVTLGVWLIVKLRRLSREHPDKSGKASLPQSFYDQLADCAKSLGLRRKPIPVVTRSIQTPAVFGLFRPVLLMPVGYIRNLSRKDTEYLLLHELAHVKRGDLIVHSLYMFLQLVYWYNPLLWLVRRRLRQLRELCCDATVARRLREETGAYRQTLLAAGRALLARPFDPGLGLLGLYENPGWLTVRLQWLQKNTWRRPWRRRISVAAVMVVMLCCVLPMASFRADAATTTEYKTKLPNGAVIELVGLYNEKSGHWWRPDGRPLEKGLLDPDMPHGPHVANCTKIFLRYENLPDGAVGRFGIDPGRGYWGGGIPILRHLKAKKNGLPVENVTWLESTLEEGAETTSVKVKLAMGHWQDHLTLPLRSRSWSSCSIGQVTFFQPYERDGRTWMPMVHLIKDRDVRVIAIDVNNVEHASADPGDGKMFIDGSEAVSHRTAQFDLPLDNIARIRFQKRPYTRIEFKNVSLVPGRSQKIEIVTTEADPFITDNGACRNTDYGVK